MRYFHTLKDFANVLLTPAVEKLLKDIVQQNKERNEEMRGNVGSQKW
jgi:hypothetical protein